MRLLLDTHIALWSIEDDERLTPAALKIISDPVNDIVVSAVSIWEIAIKHALARGSTNDIKVSGAQALEYFLGAGYEMLSVSPAHAASIDLLPRLHGDPFDRLLVAQALSEPLRLVTGDAQVATYSDSIILV